MLAIKYIVPFLLLSFTASPAKTHRQLFDDFHTGFAQRDFDKIDQLLAENFTATENGEKPDSKADYIKYMMDWNVTFNTKWDVDSVFESGDQIVSIEHDKDAFDDFFFDGGIKYVFTYSFSADQISSITYEPAKNAEPAAQRFDSRFAAFYQWVSAIHPSKLNYTLLHDKYSAEQVKALLLEYERTLRK